MAELRRMDIPPHLLEMTEFKIIEAVSEALISELEDEIQNVSNDILIGTSTEYGVARREKITGLTKIDTDTLDERRAKVLAKWYDVTPYTEETIRAKLDTICGAGNYILEIDTENDVVTIKIDSPSRDIINTTVAYLEETIMLQDILNIISEQEVETTIDNYGVSAFSGYSRVRANLA